MGNAIASLFRAGSSRVTRLAARSYIVGPELSDALNGLRRTASAGMTTTICYWNADDETPAQVADAYVRAAEALEKELKGPYLSLKAPALKFDHDVFARVVDKARETGLRLHFDALAPEQQDPTLEMIERALPKHRLFGCTLPGRWKRSLTDADWAVERRLHVRVVKGQWVDPENPNIDLTKGYLDVIDRLAGRAQHVAVASHDAPMAREALQRLKKAGTPCELELLYGLPMQPGLEVARELGVKVRVYLPYGHGWLPYLFSQVTKNPRILWWVLRDLIDPRRGELARAP